MFKVLNSSDWNICWCFHGRNPETQRKLWRNQSLNLGSAALFCVPAQGVELYKIGNFEDGTCSTKHSWVDDYLLKSCRCCCKVTREKWAVKTDSTSSYVRRLFTGQVLDIETGTGLKEWLSSFKNTSWDSEFCLLWWREDPQSNICIQTVQMCLNRLSRINNQRVSDHSSDTGWFFYSSHIRRWRRCSAAKFWSFSCHGNPSRSLALLPCPPPPTEVIKHQRQITEPEPWVCVCVCVCVCGGECECHGRLPPAPTKEDTQFFFFFLS